MEVPANGVLKYANAVGLEHPLSPTLSKDSTTRLVLSEMSRVREDTRRQVDALAKTLTKTISQLGEIQQCQQEILSRNEDMSVQEATERQLRLFKAKIERLEKRIDENDSVQELNEKLLKINPNDEEEYKDEKYDDVCTKLLASDAKVSKLHSHQEVLSTEMDQMLVRFQQIKTELDRRVVQTLELEDTLRQGQAIRDEQVELESNETQNRLEMIEKKQQKCDGVCKSFHQQLEGLRSQLKKEISLLRDDHLRVERDVLEMRKSFTTLTKKTTRNRTAIQMLHDETEGMKRKVNLSYRKMAHKSLGIDPQNDNPNDLLKSIDEVLNRASPSAS